MYHVVYTMPRAFVSTARLNTINIYTPYVSKYPSLPVTGFSPSSHAQGFEALEESFHDGKGQQELSFDGRD
jgi:hypothetical protein